MTIELIIDELLPLLSAARLPMEIYWTLVLFPACTVGCMFWILAKIDLFWHERDLRPPHTRTVDISRIIRESQSWPDVRRTEVKHTWIQNE